MPALSSIWTAIAWAFHPDTGHGVFWGSLLVTFVASVMGKDQQERLSQGKFGLAAGTSLGGLAGLMTAQPSQVVVGFVGSAVGGLLGWAFYFVLAWRITHARPERGKQMQCLLIFQVQGLEGLRDALDLQSKVTLESGFAVWGEKFSQLVAWEKNALLGREKTPEWESQAFTVMRGWIICAIDALSLVFGTLTDQDQYQSRASLIVYGTVPPQNGAAPHPGAAAEHTSGTIVGKHWIYYEGQLPPFHMTEFNQSSIGYQVLSRHKWSPYRTSTQHSDLIQNRNDNENRPFVTFRVNDHSILTVDWPGTIHGGMPNPSSKSGKAEASKKKNTEAPVHDIDPYVSAAESIFNTCIILAVREVLQQWPRDLSGVVHLDRLPDPLPGPADHRSPSHAHPAPGPSSGANGEHPGGAAENSRPKPPVHRHEPTKPAEAPAR
jgi:hypothetical protein